MNPLSLVGAGIGLASNLGFLGGGGLDAAKRERAQVNQGGLGYGGSQETGQEELRQLRYKNYNAKQQAEGAYGAGMQRSAMEMTQNAALGKDKSRAERLVERANVDARNQYSQATGDIQRQAMSQAAATRGGNNYAATLGAINSANQAQADLAIRRAQSTEAAGAEAALVKATEMAQARQALAGMGNAYDQSIQSAQMDREKLLANALQQQGDLQSRGVLLQAQMDNQAMADQMDSDSKNKARMQTYLTGDKSAMDNFGKLGQGFALGLGGLCQ